MPRGVAPVVAVAEDEGEAAPADRHEVAPATSPAEPPRPAGRASTARDAPGRIAPGAEAVGPGPVLPEVDAPSSLAPVMTPVGLAGPGRPGERAWVSGGMLGGVIDAAARPVPRQASPSASPADADTAARPAKIRPLSLPPPASSPIAADGLAASGPNTGAGAGAAVAGGLLHPPGDDSGGGHLTGDSGEGHPPDRPPDLHGSGDGWALEWIGVAGRYRIPTGVPVGTVMNISAGEPEVEYNFLGASWSGGTDYKSYMDQDATELAPPTMAVETGVATDGYSYKFIVGADARNYTITVNVEYDNGASGTSTVTFTSVRPGVTLEHDPGQPRLIRNRNPQDPQGGTVRIRFDDQTAPAWPDNAGMHITATTTTPENFGGDFMFMQVASPRRYTQGFSGQRYRQIVPGGGQAIDNSFRHNNGHNYGAVGYPIVRRDAGRLDWNGWSSGPDEEETHSMGDSPQTPSAPWSNKSLQVGNTTLAAPESFDTYVMYRPSDYEGLAVWIALAKVHWEWGLLASNDNSAGGRDGTWTEEPFLPVAPPSVENPVGEGEWFPSWVTTTVAVLGAGWVPYS